MASNLLPHSVFLFGEVRIILYNLFATATLLPINTLALSWCESLRYLSVKTCSRL